MDVAGDRTQSIHTRGRLKSLLIFATQKPYHESKGEFLICIEDSCIDRKHTRGKNDWLRYSIIISQRESMKQSHVYFNCYLLTIIAISISRYYCILLLLLLLLLLMIIINYYHYYYYYHHDHHTTDGHYSTRKQPRGVKGILVPYETCETKKIKQLKGPLSLLICERSSDSINFYHNWQRICLITANRVSVLIFT